MNNENEPQCPQSIQAPQIGEISLTQQLEEHKNRLIQKLADVQRAQKILWENPAFEDLHILLMRIW